MKPSYLGQGNDTAVLRRLDCAWLGRIFLEREMRPRAVVITEVAPQASTEVSLVQDNHKVKEVARRQLIGECLDNLLRGPGGGGTLSHVEVDDATSMMKQDNEYVEHPKGRGRHDEEVDRDEICHVVLEERSPSLRRRFRATRHKPGNGAL